MYPLKDKHCPICGKSFIPAPLHIYNYSDGHLKHLVCSYHCSLKAERERPAINPTYRKEAIK